MMHSVHVFITAMFWWNLWVAFWCAYGIATRKNFSVVTLLLYTLLTVWAAYLLWG